jgi:hypothetical protein
MAVVSLSATLKFFCGRRRAHERGENAVKSGQVVSFMFDTIAGLMKEKVQASMWNKAYDIMVRLLVVCCCSYRCANGCLLLEMLPL